MINPGQTSHLIPLADEEGLSFKERVRNKADNVIANVKRNWKSYMIMYLCTAVVSTGASVLYNDRLRPRVVRKVNQLFGRHVEASPEESPFNASSRRLISRRRLMSRRRLTPADNYRCYEQKEKYDKACGGEKKSSECFCSEGSCGHGVCKNRACHCDECYGGRNGVQFKIELIPCSTPLQYYGTCEGEKQKDIAVVASLAFFFGIFGVGRCYIASWECGLMCCCGVFKGLTLGWLLIGILVDFIIILATSSLGGYDFCFPHDA